MPFSDARTHENSFLRKTFSSSIAAHSPVSGGTEKDTVSQVELLPGGDFRTLLLTHASCEDHVMMLRSGVVPTAAPGWCPSSRG